MKNRSINKIKHSLSLFLSLLVFLIPQVAISQRSIEDSLDLIYPEKKAVGVHINGKGFKKIQKNLIPLVLNHGINIKNHYEEKFVYTLESMSIDQFSSDENIGRTFKLIRDNLIAYLKGFPLNDHRLQATLRKMSISANWKEIKFIKDKNYQLKSNEIIKGYFYFKTDKSNNASIFSKEVILEDLANPHLHHISFDNFEINLDNSRDLYISIPVLFLRDRSDQIKVKVGKPKTNLNKIKILADYDEPIRFPYIALKIEDKEYPIDTEAVENVINENKESLLEDVNTQLNDYFQNSAPEFLQKYVTNLFSGNIRDHDEIQPPGSPEGYQEEPIEWGISLADIASEKDSLELYFNGIVKDNTMKEAFPKLPYPFKGNGKINHVNVDLQKHDLTFIFDVGFANRFIHTGYFRGHLSRFMVDEETSEYIYFEESPKIYVDKKGRLKLALKAHSITKGIGKVVAKSKVHFQFELFVNFMVKNDNQVSFIIEDMDMKSLKWRKKDFRWGRRWKGEQVLKDKFKAFQKEVKKAHAAGSPPELTDEIPVPASLFGIEFDLKAVDIDPNGYILIYTNFKNL